MTAIVCLDDKNGMLFNHRRQSQDRFVRSRIFELAQTNKVWLSQYTAQQFSESERRHFYIDDDCFSKAKAADYCFVEEELPPFNSPALWRLLVFRWNRRYPADVTCPLGLEWQKLSSLDFEGHSHPKITEEVYAR